MIIYKITNTINDKVYIGVTTKTLSERWDKHKIRLRRYQRHGLDGYHLYLAMDKYGIENFNIEEIDRAKTIEEMFDKEIKYIQEYDSYNSGYNSTIGGDEDPMLSRKTYDKHSKIMKSQEVRDKISKTMKELRATEGFSQETRDKISEGLKKAYAEGRMTPRTFRREDIEKATLVKQKKVIVTFGEETKEFDSIKISCEYLLEHHFNNEITLKTLQNRATRSIRQGIYFRDVKWELL